MKRAAYQSWSGGRWVTHSTHRRESVAVARAQRGAAAVRGVLPVRVVVDDEEVWESPAAVALREGGAAWLAHVAQLRGDAAELIDAAAQVAHARLEVSRAENERLRRELSESRTREACLRATLHTACAGVEARQEEVRRKLDELELHLRGARASLMLAGTVVDKAAVIGRAPDEALVGAVAAGREGSA